MLVMVVEVCVLAIEGRKHFLMFGVVGSQILSGWLGWYLLKKATGLEYRESILFNLSLMLLLVILFTLLILQGKFDPRLGIRSDLIDDNSYLYKPKTVLLDELLRDQKMDHGEVCGICLLPIDPEYKESSTDSSVENLAAETPKEKLNLEDKGKYLTHEEIL